MVFVVLTTIDILSGLSARSLCLLTQEAQVGT